MRDLYKRLGVTPTVNLESLQRAILNCEHAGLKHDATAILLDEGYRKAYNKVHSELSHIGILRSKLGLNHAENWTGDAANDFSSPSEQVCSMHEELIAKLKPSFAQKTIRKTRNFLIGIIRAFAPFILLFGGLWLFGELASDPSSSLSSSLPAGQSKPAFNKPSQLLPSSGSVRTFINQKKVAPFQIVTSSKSNFLVKLVSVNPEKTVLDVFVRGGDTINIKVPLGEYVVKYASGDIWYGYKHYFGPSTGYNKADKTFRFNVIGNRVSGYTITLYRVTNGNLRTTSIRASDF